MSKLNCLSISASMCLLIALSNIAIAEDNATGNYSSTKEVNHSSHQHKEGELMLSYKYSRMEMDGNRNGTNSVSTAEVLNDFMVAPLDMTMEMHMFGAMYGVNDKITFMAMLPYIKKSMRHINGAGTNFTTDSEGVGDLKLTGNYTLFNTMSHANGNHSSQRLVLNFGASLPTGAIDERDNTPAGSNQKLPYPMQLGSGTVDPLLGVSYLSQRNNWSWGASTDTILRFGTNDEGYRLGNEFNLAAWVDKNLTPNSKILFKLDGKHWGDVKGRDGDLNAMMVPTARTDLRGGKRIDAIIGFDLTPRHQALANGQLSFELAVPIYQNLDGPQLETDYLLSINWQSIF